jgi:hypothetical protein
MSCRSAILIDNFLPQDVFDIISAKVAASSSYTSNTQVDKKDDLWTEAYTAVFERLKEIGLYRIHFADSVKLFGYNQFRPANEAYGNIYGPHFDNGGYILYIHPDWDESWDGKLQITNAVDEEYRTGIYAKPNRFIWIDPSTYHDVTTVSSDVTHSRVANIGFVGGDINIDPSGVDYINICTTS